MSKSLSSLRVLFMGTPDFAVPSLSRLQRAGCKIVGVFTASDKPQGRGLRKRPSSVKQYAEKEGLPLHQPPRLSTPEVQELLRQLRPDLQVVVAFRKLPKEVWDFPSMGSVNLHASLLPAYRGAAPIHWAIIRGEKKTGLSTFLITEDIDTGPLLLQEEVAIASDDTAGSLHDRMSQLGANLVLRTVEGVASGELVPRPQPVPAEECPLAPKLLSPNCEIDWHQSAEYIQNFVRGLSPRPGAWTNLLSQTCKIYSVLPVQEPRLSSGEQRVSALGLYFGTATETLSVKELQLSGKRPMPTADFLRGLRL